MNVGRPDARVLADIGGTHARFGWQAAAGAAIEQVETLPTAAHASLSDALWHYLNALHRRGHATPAQAAIAIATAITGDRVQMTNHPWSFSIAALQAEFGFTRLRVLNDFTALALALPTLGAADVVQVGGSAPVPGEAIALIGPGTGLGVSGLTPTLAADGAPSWVPLRGEGGHVTLAARNPREQAVLDVLAQRFGHASAERALSGPGLANLHDALTRIDSPAALHPPEPLLDAPTITERARAGDATCAEAVALFCAFLGTVAGNLALTLGARGGVYIGGGIVPRLGEAFARSPFRAAFEAKGRFAAYLAPVPVFVIVAAQSPALAGAARALETPG